jgi:CBS domain-containing protein
MEVTMLVKEAMTQDVRWFHPDTPVTEVARVMRDEGIGCVPIGENDRLVGMITDRDITSRAVASGEPLDRLTCRSVMSQGIFFCFEDQTLEQALGLMQERQVHHLPVLNRDKRMRGIISLGDIAMKADGAILAPLARLAARDAERHLKAA